MTPIWELTPREAHDEGWRMLELGREIGCNLIDSPRYAVLGVAQQTMNFLRKCCRVRGLASEGTRPELVKRIAGDFGVTH